MTLRPIALLAVLLLAACSSDKPKPAPTPQASRSVTMVEPVLPAHLRELSGTLSSIQGSLPRGSEVQMALLVIDERDRPQRQRGTCPWKRLSSDINPCAPTLKT